MRSALLLFLTLCLAACSAAGGDEVAENNGFSGAGGSGGSAAGGAITGGAPGAGGAIATGGGGSGAGSGGSGLSPGGECQAVSQQAEAKFKPVDIIWAVDTSGSMDAERKAVQQNLNAFAQQIAGAGIDVHVVLIADPKAMCIGAPLGNGSCPGGSKAPDFLHVESYVGSHSALSAFVGYYPKYKPALRQNSIKYFTVVTDDNTEPGNINSAAEFSSKIAALDPGFLDDWKMFGIFCTGACSANCVAVGKTYNDLVNQTGGKAGDLCGGNAGGFKPVFDALASAVISNKTLDCEWAIPAPPPGQAFDAGKVNVRFTAGGGSESTIYAVPDASQCGTAGGWYYDNPAVPTSIKVCPSTCQALQSDPNGKVDILFGCVTEQQPH